MKYLLILLTLFTLASCQESIDDTQNTTGNSDTSATSTSSNSSHDLSKNGVFHASGLDDPDTNCTSCHGASLGGTSSAPSCTSCHGEVWTGNGGIPSTHTKNKDGYWHHTSYKSPVGTCDSCHGADLRGGTAQSCYNCHGAEWLDEDDDSED